LDTEEHIED
jgi:hypothetical protein